MKTTFPLTLTLSLGEREQPLGCARISNTSPAHTALAFAAWRRTILPLLGERAGVREIAVLILCIVLTSTFNLHAQQYSIDWYKISGGGGASSGGNYQVTGTIGQPDASGAITSGNYSVTGGFWALISVVQTPGAPTLYISHSGNTVKVYWQAVSGWTLHQNNSLANPTGWSLNSSWTTSNGTNSLSLTSPAGNLFFRLSNP
jgi:hypothetical protein